jgi:hypothetical protein
MSITTNTELEGREGGGNNRDCLCRWGMSRVGGADKVSDASGGGGGCVKGRGWGLCLEDSLFLSCACSSIGGGGAGIARLPDCSPAPYCTVWVTGRYRRRAYGLASQCAGP